MTAAPRTASQGVSFQTEGAITWSATPSLLGSKMVEGLRSVIGRASVTAEVCVLWLCIGVMWDNALCDEGKTSPTNAAQVPQSAPVGEQNQTLEQDHAWHRAAALARQLSSVRAELDDAWIAGSGVVDALAGEISAFQAELDTVPIVGSKPGQPTEPETKHRQALDQERERAGALARELNSLRAKLDAAWIVGSEAVEAAEAEVKQTLEQERRRADALARELGSVHAELDAARIARQKAAQTGTAEAEQKQALKQERDQAEAVARELTSVRAELDMARAAGLEAARTAEATKIGQEQAFKQESDKTEKLALELASARKEAEANSVLLAAARAEVLEATEKNKAIAAEQSPALASEHDRAETLARELTSVRAELDTARVSGQQAAQSAEAAKIGQERAFKEERDKTERLTRELASARKEAEARSALLAAAHAEVLQATENKAVAVEQKPALASEHDRAETLARESTFVRAELDTARASGQEAARSAEAAKQSAEAAKIGQERALKEERDKTERLTRELASARKEAEARSALLAAAHAEVLQAMQTGEAAAAEQKLALARERDRADPLARELASVRNELEAANRQIAALNAHAVASCQLTVDSSELRMAEPSSRTAEDKAPRPQQISGEAVASIPGPSSASELPRPEPQSTAPEAASDSDPKVAMRTERSTSESAASRPSADEQRLLARANALLRQAEISSARPLLERALERGSARAAFMLAETYDARVLQSWRVRGISGDPAKARELYERAQAGGIEDAKERIRTLQ
jgi:hypothetical protein